MLKNCKKERKTLEICTHLVRDGIKYVFKGDSRPRYSVYYKSALKAHLTTLYIAKTSVYYKEVIPSRNGLTSERQYTIQRRHIGYV